MDNLETLIKGCKQGDTKSQSRLFDLYKKKWMGICVRYVKDADEAKDIFQEASFRIFNDIGKLRQPKTFDAWARRIMINHSLNNLRKKEAYFVVLKEYHESKSHDDRTDVHILDNMSADDILSLIDQLPDGYRVVLNLALVDGYKHSEISAALSISESTSRSQLTKAKKSLQRLIEQYKLKENARIAG